MRAFLQYLFFGCIGVLGFVFMLYFNLHKCLQDLKLFDPGSNPIFEPLSKPRPYPTMESLKIFFYGFSGTELAVLQELAEALGSTIIVG